MEQETILNDNYDLDLDLSENDDNYYNDEIASTLEKLSDCE